MLVELKITSILKESQGSLSARKRTPYSVHCYVHSFSRQSEYVLKSPQLIFCPVVQQCKPLSLLQQAITTDVLRPVN